MTGGQSACSRVVRSRARMGHENEGVACEAQALVAGYGNTPILRGVSFSPFLAGELLAVFGRNGSGKSTLLRVIAGVIPVFGGRLVRLGITRLALTPEQAVEVGVVYVPQGGGVFGSLTVEENLEVARLSRRRRAGGGLEVRQVLEERPRLRVRRRQLAATLSGGERQELALAGALLLRPRLLLLDEPSLGLQRESVTFHLDGVKRLAHEEGVAVVLVEQRIAPALAASDRAIVLQSGRVVCDTLSNGLSVEEVVRQLSAHAC